MAYGTIACRYLEHGDGAWATGVVDRPIARLTVAVPFRWLTHVWCRGLAVIDDHLVLEVDGAADSHIVTVLAVRWYQPNDDHPAELMTNETRAHWTGSRWTIDAP